MYRHPPLPIRLASPHRKLLYGTFMLLWVSGALWLVFHHFLQAQGDFGPSPHPAEIWWLRLHGMMAFAALVALGSVLPVHAQRAWQLRKNRHTGVMMKTVFGWMAITGYTLYYFASEANEAWLPILHWGVGLALPLLLFIHIRKGRRRQSLRHPANGQAAFH